MADSPTNTLSSTFILDNGSPAYFTANLTDQTRPNQPLFQPNATLPEGEHTLRVINGDGTLQLDYFTTTPPVSSTLVLVDDTDPSIQYAGPWNATTGASASAQPNYNFSLHSTLSPNATVTFSFSGTFVAVYGLYHPGPVPDASFAIDSNPPAPLTNPPAPILLPIAQSVLFQSSTLSDQTHTLTIYLNENNQADLSLDYILYQTSSSPSSSSSSPSPTVSPFSAASAGSQLASQSVSPNAGAIAGGVLGAVALIVLLLFAFKFRHYIYPSASMSIFTKRVRTMNRLSVSVCMRCFFSVLSFIDARQYLSVLNCAYQTRRAQLRTEERTTSTGAVGHCDCSPVVRDPGAQRPTRRPCPISTSQWTRRARPLFHC